MLLKKMDFKFLTCMFLLTLLCNQHCLANSSESIENIKKVTKDFIIKNVPINEDESIEVKVNQLDSKLRLSACTNEIEAAFPSDSNKNDINAIELTCNGVHPWHTYVPVTVQVMTKVLVINRNIQPKETIADADLDFVPYDKKHLYNGYYKNKEEVIGKTAYRMMTAGTVLTQKNIQQPVLVNRNQVVDLVVNKNGMIVTMKGIAKLDGKLNDSIQVYNPSSKRTLDAVVIGSGKAESLS